MGCLGTGSFLRAKRAMSNRSIATWISVSLVCTFRSYSLLMLRFQEIQLNVRSTTYLRGTTLKPWEPDGRSTTSNSYSPAI
ncbi:hypothetical protein KTT_07920 [Tengunoibacter tsumagoiensis]|uniref:Uncharacterized protein n=1 Tax=Tengunoibacter tsumagoiensis TaxID=2014871 RepID=A0A401ZVL5_9CHLR|nr:hypothetical protein KTT_07920 [Tengunoibacter tsumagoiensis]